MDKALENYLDQVDRHLRPLPASERADIIQEIRSGMLELAAAGLDAAQICQRLGEPKELAAAYLGDAITKSPGFSWSRLGSILAFCGLAGLGWMFVLPFTSVLAVGLMFSGAVAPLAGTLQFVLSLMGISVPYIMFQLGSYTAPPAVAFPLSIVVGALLFLAGRWLWRFTVRLVQTIGPQYRKLGVQ